MLYMWAQNGNNQYGCTCATHTDRSVIWGFMTSHQTGPIFTSGPQSNKSFFWTVQTPSVPLSISGFVQGVSKQNSGWSGELPSTMISLWKIIMIPSEDLRSWQRS